MSESSSIVIAEQQINEILDFYKGSSAAPHLFEAYRVAGFQRDKFVGALIMRLCLQIECGVSR
jgi:hypothetical protein